MDTDDLQNLALRTRFMREAGLRFVRLGSSPFFLPIAPRELPAPLS